MAITVPYNKLELTLASITAVAQLEKHSKEIEEDLRKFQDISINEATAKHNGITILDLINSPNMAYMVEQYKTDQMYEILKIFTKYGLSEKEAWACLVCDKLEDF